MKSKLQTQFCRFEGMLHSVVGDFSQAQQNSMKSYTSQRISNSNRPCLLSSPQHEAYFFSRFGDPNWIGPAERDIFQIFSAESGPVQEQEPGFPRGRLGLLGQNGLQKPAEVAAVFAEIVSDNPSVVGGHAQGRRSPCGRRGILLFAYLQCGQGRRANFHFID